jgi:uncharacterized protein (TIGR02001 family)
MACAGMAGVYASPGAAHAEIAVGLAATSDYRVRGLSYSDRQPVVSASLSGDFGNGVYAGAQAVVQDLAGAHMHLLGHLEYAGYARRMDDGLSWEVGVDNQHYEGYGAAPFRVNYTEAYAGLSGRNFTTRLYYSPNYNGSDHHTLYLETNAVVRPADGWRLTAHAGVFQPLNDWPFVKRRPRYDGRIDLIRTFGRAELSVGWVGATPPIGPAPKLSQGALIVGASVYF